MLSELDHYSLQMNWRLGAILEKAKISPVEWRLSLALYLNRKPISEANLAVLVGSSRATVAKHIKVSILEGFVERIDKKGVVQTPLGRSIVERFSKEALEICRGEKIGLSMNSIASLEGRDIDPFELLTLAFNPKVSLPVEN